MTLKVANSFPFSVLNSLLSILGISRDHSINVVIKIMSKKSAADLANAATNGNVDTVKKLLQTAKPGDKDCPDSTGYTPLMRAAANNHLAVVDALLSAGVDKDMQHVTEGWTALLCAAYHGHTAMVQKLLKAGVNLKKKMNDGKTALDIASNEDVKQIIAGFKTDLEQEFAALFDQISGTEARKALIHRSQQLDSQYLIYEKELNFTECARLWKEIALLNEESLQLNPSMDDFKTLLDRYKQLIQKLEAKCKELVAAQSFEELEDASHMLDTLRTVDASTLECPGSSNVARSNKEATVNKNCVKVDTCTIEFTEIIKLQDEIAAFAPGVEAREEWMQRRNAVQAEYEAAEKNNAFSECARLGKVRNALDVEESKLSLSLHDYNNVPAKRKALSERYQQLTADVSRGQVERLHAKDFPGLETLSALLTELQTIDIPPWVPVSGAPPPAPPPPPGSPAGVPAGSGEKKSTEQQACASDPKLDSSAAQDPVAPPTSTTAASTVATQPLAKKSYQKRPKPKAKCIIM